MLVVDAMLPRRALPILLIVQGTASTYFLAAGAAELFSSVKLPLDPAAVAPVFPDPPKVEPQLPVMKKPKEPEVVVEPQPVSLGPCGGDARLVIAAVDPNAPARSIAVLQTDAAGASKPMVHEGADVPSLGGRIVAVIRHDRVYLRDGSSYCWVGPKAEPKPIKTTIDTGPKGKETVAALPDTIAKGIRKVDDKTIEVDRTVRDRILEGGDDLMRDVRVSPDKEGERVLGLRLLSVRPGSLLDRFGLRAGDRLTSVNGFELASPEKILEAYAKLRIAPQLTLALVRAGSPMTVEVNIR